MLQKLHVLPRLHRALLLIGLLTVFYLIWGRAIFQYFGGLVLFIYVFFPEVMGGEDKSYNKCKDIFNLLEACGDELRVGMDKASSTVIRKVAIGQYNDKYGYVSFPYTQKITGQYTFPIAQIGPLKAWFSEHFPDLEIIQ
ncbi:hypothetical protein CWE15_00675 [Aliidiomarina taiwanensis]|uniref:Uncharacterized protein n=1 Tax=Aliidiomarina taiwanensis TaxID=946228 RepID=A0A432X927_9GAMM|nr:hypothetical protein [Aliidiomarina taiwanensis]RUO43751.1 hypothetical protein CWE15_00675 [Aliidiomarina taiwanensis]